MIETVTDAQVENSEDIFRDLDLAYSELAAKLHVDKNRLDDEVIDQPKTYEEVCSVVSLLYEQKELYEYKLKFKCSELYTPIKRQIEADGSRATEKSINSEIDQNSEVIRLNATFLRYDATHKKWDNLKRCFEQRIEVLQGVIKLLSCGYSAYSRRFD